MNKYRLNQILNTLLFPLTDPEAGKQDYLFACYQIYHKKNGLYKSAPETFEIYNKEYKSTRDKLIRYLIERNHWNVKGEDDVDKLCDLLFPMSKIEQYLMHIKGNDSVNRKTLGRFYVLEIIPMLSNALITYRDGVAAIRPWVEKEERESSITVFSGTSVFNKIEVWNLLCRMCNPDVFIAAAAVECDLGMEALYEQRTALVLADKLLVKSLQNGLAENHLHFNVGYNYDSLWIGLMDLENLSHRGGKGEDEQIKCALYRYVTALYLESEKQGDFKEWLDNTNLLSNRIKACIVALYNGDNFEPDEAILQEICKVYIDLGGEEGCRKRDYLLYGLYARYLEYKTTSEYILLFQCYRYIKDRADDLVFAQLFVQYLRIKNAIYVKSHETNLLQGFRFFQKYYDAANSGARNVFPQEERMVELFRSQVNIKYLKKLEIRITPDIKLTQIESVEYKECKDILLEGLYRQLFSVFEAYKRVILEAALGVGAANNFLQQNLRSNISDIIDRPELRTKLSAIEIPNIGIVFHLLKRRYLEDGAQMYCWRELSRGRVGIITHRLLRRYLYKNIAIAIENIRKTIPGIDEYIVGLDAASDEICEEPWMYALAYQKVRSHENTVPVIKAGTEYNRLQNMGFTYHVGEDFRHIISGLRHIDEVIEEFGYKPGDRIGHAIALGIDINRWIDDNEVVWIPKQEYLDNLLWMWGTNIYESVELEISLEKIEDKILKIADGMYGIDNNLSVQELYQAYKEKFSANHLEIAKVQASDEQNAHQKCIFCKAQACQFKQSHVKWTTENLVLTNYCPHFEEVYNEVMIVNNTTDDLKTYEILQKHIIRKIEKKGIYIETNPTSNLIIGNISEMSNHPVFALNRDEDNANNHVLLTVNSDDPAVFGTNIENELAYIYYAAEKRGYAKEEILEWIEKIRMHGMNASFIQVDKRADVILREVEDILNHIRKILEGERV